MITKEGDENLAIIHAIGTFTDLSCTLDYPSVFTKIYEPEYRNWIKTTGLAKDSANGLQSIGHISIMFFCLMIHLFK